MKLTNIQKKEPIRENQICGCPISNNEDKNKNNYCLILKKKCKKHVGWEKLKRTDLLQQIKVQEVVKHWLEAELHILHCSVVAHYKSTKQRKNNSKITFKY